MPHPCIISVAVTGSGRARRTIRPFPISIAEQVESTHAANEAGAALVHVHGRYESENSASDIWRFKQLQEGIRRCCPDILIQFSTGGRGRALDQRGAMLVLQPDMASLATGSVNFPTIVYENSLDFVRSLATSMRPAATAAQARSMLGLGAPR